MGSGDVSDLGLECRERRARGEQNGAVGPGDGLLEGALGLCEGVGEGEEDGAAAGAGGVDGGLEGADDGLGEDAVGGGEADEGGGLGVLDDLLEGLELVAGVVVAREELLVLGEAVAAVLGHESLGVDEVKLVLGFGLGQAPAGVVLEELLGDTDTGAAGAHEDELLVLDGDVGEVDGTDVAGVC